METNIRLTDSDVESMRYSSAPIQILGCPMRTFDTSISFDLIDGTTVSANIVEMSMSSDYAEIPRFRLKALGEDGLVIEGSFSYGHGIDLYEQFMTGMSPPKLKLDKKITNWRKEMLK